MTVNYGRAVFYYYWSSVFYSRCHLFSNNIDLIWNLVWNGTLLLQHCATLNTSKVNLNLFMHFIIEKLLTGEIAFCFLDFDTFNLYLQDSTHFRYIFALFPDQSDVNLQFIYIIDIIQLFYSWFAWIGFFGGNGRGGGYVWKHVKTIASGFLSGIRQFFCGLNIPLNIFI
jgi:hypothetical protein